LVLNFASLAVENPAPQSAQTDWNFRKFSNDRYDLYIEIHVNAILLLL
jgi:hypothetical protein